MTAFSELDDLVELWIELVTDQRASGSRLRAKANRTPIREALARHVAAGGVLVAHKSDVSNGGAEVGSSAEDADADSFVGFVMFDIEAGAYEQDATRGMVRNLFVRPVYRDTGVGTRLLAAAEDALTDAGVGTVASDVLTGDEAACRFYRWHDCRSRRVELEKSMRSDTHLRGDG